MGLPVHPFSMPEAEREPARAKSIRLLDVLTDEEYAAGHIPGRFTSPAGSHPVGFPAGEAFREHKDPVCLCESGFRSYIACLISPKTAMIAIIFPEDMACMGL